MGITESAVKVYRSRAMRKLNARSLPELGRMAEKLKLVSDNLQPAKAHVRVFEALRHLPARVLEREGIPTDVSAPLTIRMIKITGP
jgi:hypothetical protein